MTEAHLPDYESLKGQLQNSALPIEVAELHGLMVGLLASGHIEGWTTRLSEFLLDGEHWPQESQRWLKSLWSGTQLQLSEGQFEFQVLLPSDDEPVAERADALVKWISSYLVGFACGMPNLKQCSDDLQEVIGDLTKMTNMATDIDTDDEEHEQALVEIVEYLRVGVMMCFHECNRPPSADQTSTTLH